MKLVDVLSCQTCTFFLFGEEGRGWNSQTILSSCSTCWRPCSQSRSVHSLFQTPTLTHWTGRAVLPHDKLCCCFAQCSPVPSWKNRMSKVGENTLIFRDARSLSWHFPRLIQQQNLMHPSARQDFVESTKTEPPGQFIRRGRNHTIPEDAKNH